jgi:hypothetical protein|tara:strand:- start:7 stop:252 length:246 start_codon:yes stop_codon:yes gene_type:complete
MSTDTQLLGKGLIRLGILVFLFIASPIILTMGFKAFDRFSDSPKIYIAYLLVLAGFAAIIFTIYFAFKTFKIISNSLFNNK